MQINPIYRKELKTSVRTNKLYTILFIYNGLLALFTLFTFLIVFRNDIRSGVVEYSIILKVYGIIAAIEFGLLLFIVPSVTASKISGEREKETIDLLLIANISTLQIIVGKLISSISLMTLLAFSSFPILSLVFIIGGISIGQMFEFLILIIVSGIYIGSIGIFFSTILKKTILATVTTYTVVLALVIGTFMLVWGVYALKNYGISITNISNDLVIPMEYILLINPGFTYISMIGEQIGSRNILFEIFELFHVKHNVLMEYWFVISIVIQLIISFVLCYFASKSLEPIKRKRNVIE